MNSRPCQKLDLAAGLYYNFKGQDSLDHIPTAFENQ